jgi:hypothetical protein
LISHWNGIGVKDGKVTGIGLGKHFPEALLQGHCNPCCSAQQSFTAPGLQIACGEPSLGQLCGIAIESSLIVAQ